jgi:hypothetical protein
MNASTYLLAQLFCNNNFDTESNNPGIQFNLDIESYLSKLSTHEEKIEFLNQVIHHGKSLMVCNDLELSHESVYSPISYALFSDITVLN